LTAGIAGAGRRLDVPLVTVLGETIRQALFIVGPLFAVLVAISLLAPALTGGWNFSLKPLAPKLEKLSPLKGFKRMFGPKGLVELAKALGKALVVGTVGVVLLRHMAPDLLSLGSSSVRQGLGATAAMAGIALLAKNTPCTSPLSAATSRARCFRACSTRPLVSRQSRRRRVTSRRSGFVLSVKRSVWIRS